MLYPVAILKSDEKTAHGLFFPDVLHLASACDELDEVLKVANEALDIHFQGLVEDGEEIPLPTSFEAHANNPEYEGMMWAWVDVDLSRYDNKVHKINVTLPNSLIAKIDDKVNSHKSLYKNRSNYLAQLASRDLMAG